MGVIPVIFIYNVRFSFLVRSDIGFTLPLEPNNSSDIFDHSTNIAGFPLTRVRVGGQNPGRRDFLLSPPDNKHSTDGALVTYITLTQVSPFSISATFLKIHISLSNTTYHLHSGWPAQNFASESQASAAWVRVRIR